MGASFSFSLVYHYAYYTNIPRRKPVSSSRLKKHPYTKVFYSRIVDGPETVYLRKLK
jgi:hypothetical protein